MVVWMLEDLVLETDGRGGKVEKFGNIIAEV